MQIFYKEFSFVARRHQQLLKGVLHTCRRFEYCRDVILLVSEKTPADYISHLKARNYHYIVAGKEKVDLRSAIEQLRKNFKINKILT